MRRILSLLVVLCTVALVATVPAWAEHVIAFEFGTQSDSSGFRQSLSTTGTTFALGVAGGEPGAYVSVHAADTGAEITRIDAPDPTMNLFGDAIALSDRGLAIGAPHAFETRGGVFIVAPRDVAPTRTYVGPTDADRNFGSAIAWTGDSVLVGDRHRDLDLPPTGPGHAYLFHPRTGAVRQTLSAPVPQDGAGFGAAVAAFSGGFAVAEVGTSVLPGAVHVYDRRGRHLQTLTAPVPTPGDAFGAVLAASGAQLLIGAPSTMHAPDARAAYLARRERGRWRIVRTFTGDPYGAVFGPAVAIDGHRILLGSPANYAGAFLFDTRTSGLTEHVAPPPFDGDGNGYHAMLGSVVAFAGRTLLVASSPDDEDYAGWVVGYRPRPRR